MPSVNLHLSKDSWDSKFKKKKPTKTKGQQTETQQHSVAFPCSPETLSPAHWNQVIYIPGVLFCFNLIQLCFGFPS